MGSLKIIGTEIEHITYKEAISSVVKLGVDREPSYICFTNVHMSIEGWKDDDFQKIVNHSKYSFADGMPIAKSCNILYDVRQDRIPGMLFFRDLLRECSFNNLNVFLFGGSEEELEMVYTKANSEFKGIQIVGRISPPFDKEWDNISYVDIINKSKANVVFVSLGCPKQEKWMGKYSKQINSVMLGVGGALAVYAGVQKRSPKWMSDNGLEWLFRLIQEPRRLFKRYLYTNSLFIVLLVKQILYKNILRKI